MIRNIQNICNKIENKIIIQNNIKNLLFKYFKIKKKEKIEMKKKIKKFLNLIIQ